MRYTPSQVCSTTSRATQDVDPSTSLMVLEARELAVAVTDERRTLKGAIRFESRLRALCLVPFLVVGHWP